MNREIAEMVITMGEEVRMANWARDTDYERGNSPSHAKVCTGQGMRREGYIYIEREQELRGNDEKGEGEYRERCVIYVM